MADYAPVYGRPSNLQFNAGATVTGGQVLSHTSNADEASPTSGATAAIAGVAGHDAASGKPVTVHAGAGVVHETLCSAAVAAGALLQTAAGGKVAGGATAGSEIGVALRATTAGDQTLRWVSRRF